MKAVNEIDVIDRMFEWMEEVKLSERDLKSLHGIWVEISEQLQQKDKEIEQEKKRNHKLRKECWHNSQTIEQLKKEARGEDD